MKEPGTGLKEVRKDGGAEIVNEQLEWNTSNGGTLKPGEKMNASYIFEPGLSQDTNYNQSFRAENVDKGSGSEYDHNTSIILRDPGKLNVKMHEPPEDSRLQSNRTFEVNAIVECFEGECGDVDVAARYNGSDGWVDIPDTQDRPFYTVGNNPKTCQDMVDGDRCSFNWGVNATGEVGSEYVIDTEARSPISEAEKSASTSVTLSPNSLSATPRLTHMLVFPTPPFPEIIPIILPSVI